MNGSSATAKAVGCVISSKRMSFGLSNWLPHLPSSNNIRCIVDICNIPSITDWLVKMIL
jgi:hypothetical protein